MKPRKVTFVFVLLAVLVSSAPAFPGEKHLLIGTWSVDVSKLQQPDPPKSVTITFAEAGGGEYRMTVDIVSPDGTKSRAEGTFKPDGTASRGQGSLDVDIVSMPMARRTRGSIPGPGSDQPTDDGEHWPDLQDLRRFGGHDVR